MKNQNSKFTAILFAFTLISAAVAPKAPGVLPAPDGGYPGGNTAEGQAALLSLTTGGFNTAVGYLSLRSNAIGQLNTAIGAGTLLANIGDANTATGAGALLSNAEGSENTANGAFALYSNLGSFNTASGAFALFRTTGAIFDTAIGYRALDFNITGSSNTAIGASALHSNTDSSGNTAVGAQALINATGSGNIGLGFSAGDGVFTAADVICIGASGANVSGTTWIDNIYGVTTQSGTTASVIVSDTGQLGTIASSERFKKDIATIYNASEAIFSLRPVSFHYKTDASGTTQLGLIAEEVAKVNPALVIPDKEGKPYSVRYESVNVMLLNEFLKDHKKLEKQAREIQEQRATISELKKAMETAVARLGEQDSKIQRVSDQVEVSKLATRRIGRDGPLQLLLNNQ
jgi:hypothetical protein